MGSPPDPKFDIKGPSLKQRWATERDREIVFGQHW
jgi:hypothetical protein